jgi:hypothetical protein
MSCDEEIGIDPQKAFIPPMSARNILYDVLTKKFFSNGLDQSLLIRRST